MPRVDLSVGEQAWEKYNTIKNLLGARAQKSAISQALQLLGEAIILQHGLVGKLPFKKWRLKLEEQKVHELALTNIYEMTHAQIPSWEQAIEAIPDMQVGHDSWVDGTPGRLAGYYPHPSLCQLMGEHFFKEIISSDMTHADASQLYQRISNVISIEINRYSDSDKTIKIVAAMQRLLNGIDREYNASVSASKRLYSIDSMLDAQLNSDVSVREALNLSRINPLNLIFGPLPVLWGKTTSLTNVEMKLSQSAKKEVFQ